MFACPITRGPLVRWTSAEGRRYPLLDGIPVLVPEPEAFLVRHAPDWRRSGVPTARRVDIPVDAPDAITPHLPQNGLGGHGSFAAWIQSLGADGPVDRAARWGEELAPPGPALDLGCGVGPMTRRMAESGRETYAIDRSPRAVLLARDLLFGRLRETGIPTHRGGYRMVRFPYRPLDERRVNFAIADATTPPFSPSTFAWVHVGNLLDVTSEQGGEVLFSAINLLVRGGLLTVTTPYDGETVPVEDEVAPEAQLREVIEELGCEMVAEVLHAPLVLREYDRGYRVLFCHCIAARAHG